MLGRRKDRTGPDKGADRVWRRRRRVRRPSVEWLEDRLVPSAITSFPVSTAGNALSDLTAGPDGNLWFSDGVEVGRITPTGTVTEFPVPSADAEIGNLTAGPDGNLWFTAGSAGIGRTTPAGVVTMFALPDAPGAFGNVTVGPDGNLWFDVDAPGLAGTASIGRITPAGVVTVFPLLSASFTPGTLVVGSDGNLWFSEQSTDYGPYGPLATQLGRITPTGVVTDFAVPIGGTPTVGPDGNLWFPEDAGEIGRITPAGAVTNFTLPRVTGAREIGPLVAGTLTVGPDGNLGFGARAFVGVQGWVGRITPTGAVTLFPLAPIRDVYVGSALTVDPDGNLWFVGASADGEAGSIVRVTMAGLITEFDPASGGSFLTGQSLTVGPDGDLWFSDGFRAEAIERIDPSALGGTGVVAVSRSGTEIAAIVLGFDDALDPQAARKRGSYSLSTGTFKRTRHRSSVLIWRGVKIGELSYRTATNMVRLRLAGSRKGPLAVTVRVGAMAADDVSGLSDFITVIP
jgi:streptogramin lyase